MSAGTMRKAENDMIDEIKKEIEDSYYWDARVKVLDCKYWGDEVTLVFDDDGPDITYHFTECYQVEIAHDPQYPKDIPSKNLTPPQVPYFFQDVEVEEIDIDETKYLRFKINMYPINLSVMCKKFSISRQ